MRIHLVTDRFHLGGGLEHIYQVAKGLKEIQFGIFAKPGTNSAYEKFSNMKNVEICNQGYSPDIVMEKEPDLVHIHHLKPLAAFFKKPGKKYNIPIFYTAHGLHIRKYEFYGSISAKTKYFLRFQLEKRILPKAKRIIAVSREDKHFLEEKYRLKNVTYLTNGIDFSAIPHDKGSGESKTLLRKELNLPEDDFLFITVARFDFQKGYDILIKAIAKIKDTLERTKTNCRFVFVGDGSEFAGMKVLSQCLSVSPYILFLGGRTDVYDILKAGDVFLLPSRWEGLPIVLLETGLLNVPVIASDTYGNREVIKEGNGILFKNLDIEALAQVIMEVLQNKYDLAAFVKNLFQEIQINYSLEKMLSGLREIYFNHG
jgi:glycosyltransferase involved in cell wall biosynthesis